MKREKRTGRPVKAAKSGTKVSLGLKVTADVKAKLDQAAARSGRTQSQEAELRLTQSFENASIAAAAMVFAYGPRTTAMALTIARVMHDAGTQAGILANSAGEGTKDWLSNPAAYDRVVREINAVLDGLRPDGAYPPLKPLGPFAAKDILEALAASEKRGDIGEWAQPIRKMLGPVDIKLVEEQALPPALVKSEPSPIPAPGKHRKEGA